MNKVFARRIGPGRKAKRIVVLLTVFFFFIAFDIGVNAAGQTPEQIDTEVTEKDISIRITEPEEEWIRDSYDAKIQIEAVGEANFQIKSVTARAGEGAKDIDITDEMTVKLTDNCRLYITVRDTEGARYSKEFEINYFDLDGPELIGAVTDGILHIQVSDDKSGIQSLFINGYEYADCPDGELSIRLQQFDASYEQFQVFVTDKVGNCSDEYIVDNPYFQTEEEKKDADYSAYLPINAEHSAITSAVGSVITHATGYGFTRGTGEVLTISGNTVPGYDGMEFYIVQTMSGKTFYMVIDKAKDDNNAYLLTEVDENDLLHFSGTESQVLPQNGAVIAGTKETSEKNTKYSTAALGNETAKEEENPTGSNSNLRIFISGGAALVVGLFVFFVRRSKRKKEGEEENPSIPIAIEEEEEEPDDA